MGGMATVDSAASAEGAKRTADEPAAGEPAAKAAKVDGTPEKEKKEKKDKDDKKDKKEKKAQEKEEQLKASLVKSGSSADLDHRKLFKEGQKNICPPVADSTRAFYESLLEENPDSKIAIKFCVEYGVLPLEQHKKLLHKYNKLREKGAFSMGALVKKMVEKKEMKDGGKEKKEKKDKDGKEKKEKKDKDGKEKKEKKEGKDGEAAGGA